MNKRKKVLGLLIQYSDIVDKLKKLGVTRTTNIVAGYGEYISRKKLHLKQAKSATQKGYDAIDKWYRKYEIKAGKATPGHNRNYFNCTKKKLKYVDFVIYAGFDNNWNLQMLLKIPAKKVKPTKGIVILNKRLMRYNLIKA